MSERRLIRLGEYDSVDIAADHLTGDDLTRLRGLTHRRALTVAETRKGWRISAGATVGMLVLDRVRLLIEPKFVIDGDRLLQWLAYALDVPIPSEKVARQWATGPDGYAALVAAALLAECRDLLRDGLHRAYRRHDHIEPVLRGRLDILAQATRRYGQLDQLHAHTFDRDIGVWENQVLNTALREARRLVTQPDLARTLATTARAFPDGPATTTTLSTLYRAEYNRLNARYRPAHTWARLLLAGGGVTDLFTDAGLSADTLLLDMPRLWERVTRRLVSRAAAANDARVLPSVSAAAITTTGDIGKSTPFRPDVLVQLGNDEHLDAGWLPMDAKYKTYDRERITASDMHQLLTYIAGYPRKTAATGVIIHPHNGNFGHRVLKVTGPQGVLGAIHIVGINTQIEPRQAATWLASNWNLFAR